MTLIEEWKPCKDYEGLYEVSNLGRVRSCDKQVHGGGGKYYFKKGAIKKQNIRKDGYVTVALYKDNKGKHIRVHRLVAHAFIENPNPNEYKDVNHIDCDRSNNEATNLEWVNPLLNHIHSNNLGRKTKPRLHMENRIQILFQLVLQRLRQMKFIFLIVSWMD